MVGWWLAKLMVKIQSLPCRQEEEYAVPTRLVDIWANGTHASNGYFVSSVDLRAEIRGWRQSWLDTFPHFHCWFLGFHDKNYESFGNTTPHYSTNPEERQPILLMLPDSAFLNEMIAHVFSSFAYYLHSLPAIPFNAMQTKNRPRNTLLPTCSNLHICSESCFYEVNKTGKSK